MDISELKYWIAFNRVRRVGPRQSGHARGPLRALSEAVGREFHPAAAGGLDRRTAANAARSWSRIDPDAEMDRVQQAGVTALTCTTMATHPGSRRYTTSRRLYVKAKSFLRTNGLSRWSGLAADRLWARSRAAGYLGPGAEWTHHCERTRQGRGRHRASRRAGRRARTIAALGSGLDVMYPREHAELRPG